MLQDAILTPYIASVAGWSWGLFAGSLMAPVGGVIACYFVDPTLDANRIRHGPRYETLIAHFQNRAIGFSGDPVPPGTVSGAAVIRKVYRLRVAAAALNASKSKLSKIGVPIATS